MTTTYTTGMQSYDYFTMISNDMNGLSMEDIHQIASDVSSMSSNGSEAVETGNPLQTIATPEIVNVVSTFQINCQNINLFRISQRVRNTEYNPRRFSGLIMRITNPKATALVFSTGKVVCMGTKSVEESKFASKRFAKILKKTGLPVKYSNYTVQNIVATGSVNHHIQMALFANDHWTLTKYNPEAFPGIIYEMAEPKMTLLIFKSGKIVFLGAKDIDSIHLSFRSIYQMLLNYRV